MGIAGLVIGIIAIIIMWVPVIGMSAIPISIVGIIVSVIAEKKAKTENAPTGMATAGLVISIIALVLSGIITIACGACTACALCANAAMY